MNRSLFVVVYMTLTLHVTGQEIKRDNIWMLGNYTGPGIPQSGMNFNSGSPDTFSLMQSMHFFFTHASICDTTGQLLFYTNGCYAANRFHLPFPHTAGFNPGFLNSNHSSTGQDILQAALILPWPDHPSRYALVHSSGEFIQASPSYPGGFAALSLRCSPVEMDLDSGRGDLTSQMNTIVIDDTLALGHLTACKKSNGRDWWIVAHQQTTNRFYMLELTPDTLKVSHSQDIGPTIVWPMDGQSYTVINPSGNRLAFINHSSRSDIYSFVRCNGELSEDIPVYFTDSTNWPISAAFSPSGRFLYVNNRFQVYQFDLQSADVNGSRLTVATYDGYMSALGTHSTFCVMNLAPDSKIYISTYDGTDLLHVINQPDQPGLACDLQQHSFVLPHYNNTTMTNPVNYALGPEPDVHCDTVLAVNPVNSENDFRLFPNPAFNTINISTPAVTSGGVFMITNSTGQVVFSKIINGKDDLKQLDVHSLHDGVYHCNLMQQTSDQSIRFIIMH